jgi:lysophospholipase L1-like esterase
MLKNSLSKKFWLNLMLLLLANFIIFSSFVWVIKSELNKEKQDYAYQYIKNNIARLSDSMNEESIVFLGSSSIQGLNTGSIINEAMNLGIGGENLQQLLERVSTYRKLSSVKVVVFMAGFNDVCEGSNIASQRFGKLLSNLSETALVIVGLQPSFSSALCNNLREEIDSYNNELTIFCNQHINCEYIDLAAKLKLLANRETLPLDKYFEEDGIHLNQKGYKYLEQEISKALNNLLRYHIK